MTSKNAAFSGGGVSSVVGLGMYFRMAQKTDFESFSGASIGSVIAACLAAGKTPIEIREFLANNVKGFCAPILGRIRIHKKVDEFLDNMLFKDLPKECIVSITPIRRNFPKVITRENAGSLTVGEVVALSSALPGLFLPGLVKLEGKYAIVLDGGMTANPPLKEGALNVCFSFKRSDKVSKTPWNKRKIRQEESAHILFKPYTKTHTRGESKDVYIAFLEGSFAMKRELPQYGFLPKKNVS